MGLPEANIVLLYTKIQKHDIERMMNNSARLEKIVNLLSKGILKDKDKLIKQAEDIGYKQTEEILKDIPFSTYDEILFVSKIVEKMRRVIEKPIKEEIIETEANTSLIVLSFPNDVSTALVDKS